jgi:hypothetical protein
MMLKTNFDFKRCYPSREEFFDVIQIKTADEWEIQKVSLADGVEYYLADDPFKGDGFEIYRDLVAAHPICSHNNGTKPRNGNPFEIIHIGDWVAQPLCLLIKEKFSLKGGVDLAEWGNVYHKGKVGQWEFFTLPHCDAAWGMIGNLWFTDHDVKDSGTHIYRYDGHIEQAQDNQMYYDYQINQNHPLYDECKRLSHNQKKATNWTNITPELEEYWGFTRLDTIPSRERTMSLYAPNIPHTAYISDSIDFRWSHTFAVTKNFMQLKNEMLPGLQFV